MDASKVCDCAHLDGVPDGLNGRLVSGNLWGQNVRQCLFSILSIFYFAVSVEWLGWFLWWPGRGYPRSQYSVDDINDLCLVHKQMTCQVYSLRRFPRMRFWAESFYFNRIIELKAAPYNQYSSEIEVYHLILDYVNK